MLIKFFNFRIDEPTQLRLDILAQEYHRTKSNLVRWLIHKEFENLGANNQDLDDNLITRKKIGISTILEAENKELLK